jgi:hypothetical protein
MLRGRDACFIKGRSGLGNGCSEPKEEVSLRRRWSYGYNTMEKGNAKIKKSRTEQMKLWRKHSLGVLALKRL